MVSAVMDHGHSAREMMKALSENRDVCPQRIISGSASTAVEIAVAARKIVAAIARVVVQGHSSHARKVHLLSLTFETMHILYIVCAESCCWAQ